MRINLRTKSGNDFYNVASGLQKGIRRADARVAGYCGIDLFESGYYKYVWLRLLTISAEDCYGIITKEIWALKQSFDLVYAKNKKGRIFISKAIILLCSVKHNRDADHLQCLVYDKQMVSAEELQEHAERLDTHADENVELPEYIYDVHTAEGRRRGKTKKAFFKDEQEGLVNRQSGLFDNLVDKV